jgi:hypothetical protein
MENLHEIFLEQMSVEIPLILGMAPSGGVLLLTMSKIHSQMFLFRRVDGNGAEYKNYRVLVQQLGLIIDMSIEIALVKICTAFQTSNDFKAVHRALLQLTQGCKDVAICMNDIFDPREYPNASGFHTFLRGSDIFLQRAPAMHEEVASKCKTRISKEMTEVYRKLVMTCLMSTSRRVPKNSLLNLIMSHEDLRTCVLWNEQANVIKFFNTKVGVENNIDEIMIAANIPRYFWPT